MKLEVEVFRDILIVVEKNALPHNGCDLVPQDFPERDFDIVSEHARQLVRSGFIEEGYQTISNSTFAVRGLTIEGQSLLESIRSETIWTKTMEVAKKTGVTSILGIWDISKSVAAAAIAAGITQ